MNSGPRTLKHQYHSRTAGQDAEATLFFGVQPLGKADSPFSPSVAIMDYEKSLSYDVGLLRSSSAVPKSIKLYGFFFDINSGMLTEVVRDIPA